MAKEKIVVIDDSPIVRKLAELALEEEGYKVYTAEDGEEGLRISEEVRPSVILVDFIMPRISGYQFCKSARENELLKDIPIILITGKGEDVGKKFAEKFGVVDYFIKPFKSEMLVEKVNSIVNSQRQLMGEEPEVFAAGAEIVEPSAETPAFAFEEAGTVEAPEPEVAGLPELPETPAFSFEAEEAPVEEVPAAGTIEEVPEFSFEAIDVQEELEKIPEAPVDELDLGSPSFDFNLEGLTVQDIEVEEEQKIGAPVMPETPEVYDFEAIQQLPEPAVVEKIAEPVTGPVTEPAAVADYAPVPGREGAIESIMRRYVTDELPMLIEKGVADVLKQYGVIKPSTILITGNLENICPCAVLKLLADQQLTGKLFILSVSGSAEVYFDKGLVVYALTSRRGKSLAVAGEVPDLNQTTLEALSMVANLREGNFFFEKMALPAAFGNIPRGKNAIALLIESMRKSAAESGWDGPGSQDSIYVKAVSDAAAQDCGLTAEEQQLFSLADGHRNAAILSALSGVELTQTLMILDRLARAGVLRNQGGF